MKSFVPVGVIACSLLLTGCTPSDADQSDGSADPCVFLAGGAYADAVDFFLDYATSPDSANSDDLAAILDRFEDASSASTGELAAALDSASVEFSAIKDRLTGGDPLTPVDYQALQDALDSVGSACIDGAT